MIGLSMAWRIIPYDVFSSSQTMDMGAEYTPASYCTSSGYPYIKLYMPMKGMQQSYVCYQLRSGDYKMTSQDRRTNVILGLINKMPI